MNASKEQCTTINNMYVRMTGFSVGTARKTYRSCSRALYWASQNAYGYLICIDDRCADCYASNPHHREMFTLIPNLDIWLN